MLLSKPHLKRRLDGSIEVLTAGFHAMGDDGLHAFILKRSGSLLSYCIGLGLNYGHVSQAFRPGAFEKAGVVGYTRLLLGLPIEPSKAGLSICEQVYGDTRIRDLLGPHLQLRSSRSSRGPRSTAARAVRVAAAARRLQTRLEEVRS